MLNNAFDPFKKPVAISCLAVWLLSSGQDAGAKETVQIVGAELIKHDQYYALSAKLSYQLSERAKAALQYGVPLYWHVNVKIRQAEPYWPDAVLAGKTVGFRLQYHALLNLYQVYKDNTGVTDSFSTLSSALDRLSDISAIDVIERSAIAKDASYYAELKIAFDREALPLPLRPVAYLNSQWSLSSATYIWPLSN
jgi:hypothetical protein